MNIAKKVMNLNIYLIKQQKDSYMKMIYDSLGGRIFDFIDLNTGLAKHNKYLLLIENKTGLILNFISDNEILNKKSNEYARLESINTSYLQNAACKNGTPIFVSRGEKIVSLTITLPSHEIILEGSLEHAYRKDNYAVLGLSCFGTEISCYY